MVPRKTFRKIAKSELKSHLFLPFNLNYDWFMDETVQRWQGEGLPKDADLIEFFGFDKIDFVDAKTYMPIPCFERKVISEDEDTKIIRNETGAIIRVFKEHEKSRMPQWLEYPIKSRKDFREYKKRLNPYSPERHPVDWDSFKKARLARDYPLGVDVGSFYGHTLQQWLGTESLCMLFYDEPGFVHEMTEHLEYFFLEQIRRYVEEIDFDFAAFGEDIAFKGRSFMSPAMFREFIQPRYVKIVEFLRSHGIDIVFVDSDGCIDELIPLWMEVGINGFSPLEVAAGEDALALKQKYGSDIVLAGNVDKRALISGKEAIDREVAKVKRLLDMGGYFPAIDHSVPPDVALGNFTYYLQKLKELSN
jgi:uroporphyrinogen decarboxylase